MPAEAWPDRLEALRARGADRADPVRFRWLEALARRAAQHSGAVRALLDQRLAQGLARFPSLADTPALDAGDEAGNDARRDATAPPAGSPLAALLDHVARHATLRVAPGDGPADLAADAARDADAAGELKTLAYFRQTWSRLSAEQRVRQSLAERPENAGPLNSQGLAHRALALMQQLSPAYLQHFVGQVDGLLWLEAALAARAAEAAPKPTVERKKPPRGKRQPT